MLEITSTRHNPLVDPVLSVWSWEIPVYLFFGGMIAGMMILAGTVTLVLAALALWGGSKLRDKADARAYALEKATKGRA